MPLFDARLSNHAALDSLRSLSGALDEQLPKIVDESTWESLQRARTVVGYLRSTLYETDGTFVAKSDLDVIQKHADALYNAVDGSYVSIQAKRIDEDTDQLAIRARQLSISSSIDPVNFTEQVTEFSQQLSQLASSAERELSQLRDKVAEVKATSDRQKQEIDRQVSEAKNRMETQLSRVDEVVSTVQRGFQEAEQLHSDNVDSLIHEKSEQADAVIEEMKQKREAEVERLRDGFERALEELEQQRDKAERIYQVAVAAGVAGGFQRDAKRHVRQSHVWSAIAVLSLLLLAVIGLWAVFQELPSDPVSATQLSVRLLVFAGGMGAMARFASNQAKVHKYHERVDREMELKLQAIGPFAEGFEDSGEGEKLRSSFGDKVFNEPMRIPDPSLRRRDVKDEERQEEK